MGSTTALTPDRTGEKASVATERTPEVTTWKPPRASRVMMVTAASTRSRSVVRGRRERRGGATSLRTPRRSAGRGGDEDLLQCLELLEALPTADGHAIEWVACHHDGHARLLGQSALEPVQEGTATGQDDALLHDVGGQFRRGPVQRHLDGVDNGRHRLVDGLADLLGRNDDGLRQTGDQVAAANLGVELLFEL